jgi:Ca-activated chloride channel family protein
MSGALEYALTHPGDNINPNELTQIIFITDGAVYNEAELFGLINLKLGDARLFTVGIGSAPNTYFMQKAAQFGRGTATMISDLTQVNQRVTELFKTISAPVLRDLSIDWGTPVEHYPSKLPDLYQGEPISLVVHSAKPLNNIKLYGKMLDAPWQTQLRRGDKHDTNSVRLDVVWARQKIADLMDQLVHSNTSQHAIEKQVLEIGLRHQLLTKFTSFVAVEQVVSRPKQQSAKQQSAKQDQIPNLIPKGSTMSIPQTATVADLLLWLGLLVILVGIYLIRREHTKGQSHAA